MNPNWRQFSRIEWSATVAEVVRVLDVEIPPEGRPVSFRCRGFIAAHTSAGLWVVMHHTPRLLALLCLTRSALAALPSGVSFSQQREQKGSWVPLLLPPHASQMSGCQGVPAFCRSYQRRWRSALVGSGMGLIYEKPHHGPPEAGALGFPAHLADGAGSAVVVGPAFGDIGDRLRTGGAGGDDGGGIRHQKRWGWAGSWLSMRWDRLPGLRRPAALKSSRSLPACRAPDRVWLGRVGALLPGVECSQLGQIGASDGAGCLTAVEGAAGDRREAFFRHGWFAGCGGGAGIGSRPSGLSQRVK